MDWITNDYERVDMAKSTDFAPVKKQRMAVRAHRRWKMPELATFQTLLDPEFTSRSGLPKTKLIVW
jgi:hypothetical protein|tara:strand:+ start:830 stop:1027 length:198 start_codon:yes stop_codon:yes gene_type:complete